MWLQLDWSMELEKAYSTFSSRSVPFVTLCTVLENSYDVARFQSAWHGDTPALPVFGDGANILPTIHVHDLARWSPPLCTCTCTNVVLHDWPLTPSVVVCVAELRPSKPRYLLAVDESKNTLKEIVTAISRQLTTGKTTTVSREQALLIKDLAVSKPLSLEYIFMCMYFVCSAMWIRSTVSQSTNGGRFRQGGP